MVTVMKIIVTMGTPAQFYFFKYAIGELVERGHNILIASRETEAVVQLLNNSGFNYKSLGKRRNSNYLGIMLLQLEEEFRLLKLARRFKPDYLIAFTGIGASHIGRLIGKPSIVFTDSEGSTISNILSFPFASVIITPSSFRKKIGRKHVRFNGFKELAYLHPNYFKPDISIYDELGLAKDDKFIVVRFNAFKAFHDIGKRGFTFNKKIELINQLSDYARVFVSAERGLPPELHSYILPTSPHRIHQVLYYAQLLVSDSATMNTESAVLGTPSITCLSNADQFGNFIELEYKYDLLYAISEPERAITKAIELIKQPDLKKKWAKKRLALLEDKIDVTRFMVDFIENYPESYKNYR